MHKTKRVSILLEIAIRWCVKQDYDFIFIFMLLIRDKRRYYLFRDDPMMTR